MNSKTSGLELEKHPWYKQWFDSQYYHSLYKNRDEKEASDFIENLVYCLKPKYRSKMIDVGCGAGRHCFQLAKHGYQVTGIDLSFYSILQAKKYQMPNLRFLQHDMRKSYGFHYCDYVFNFFTSFGYFKDREEHQEVIANMANALKPGGKLIMDYLNVYRAATTLKASEIIEIDGIEYQINRWVTKSHFYKQINIRDNIQGSGQEYVEQVARFSLNDFKKIFSSVGLQIEQVYGDYQLNKYDRMESPRLIMIAGKTDELFIG
jgi:SAM-dependent methyltransferase